ncbi:TPA: hypothetical protein ACISY6_004488, partial [Salmonella enterica subsp. enterica serovar Eastbourne]
MVNRILFPLYNKEIPSRTVHIIVTKNSTAYKQIHPDCPLLMRAFLSVCTVKPHPSGRGKSINHYIDE